MSARRSSPSRIGCAGNRARSGAALNQKGAGGAARRSPSGAADFAAAFLGAGAGAGGEGAGESATALTFERLTSVESGGDVAGAECLGNAEAAGELAPSRGAGAPSPVKGADAPLGLEPDRVAKPSMGSSAMGLRVPDSSMQVPRIDSGQAIRT